MELFRLVWSNSSCWHAVFTDGVSQYCTFTQAQTRCTTMCHLPILVDCIFISLKCTFLLTRCGVVYHWDLSLLYYQVQKWVYVKTGCGKSVQHSLKQNEYSGSVPFVVALIGCFLRKLLRPVCAKVQSESTEYFKVLSIYIKLNLCLAGHFLLPGLSFSLSCCTMWAVHYTCLHSLERQHSTGENKRATAAPGPVATQKNTESCFRVVIAFLLSK